VPRFWKHSFESAYFFPQTLSSATIHMVGQAAEEKFRTWARDTNGSLAHWADRWGETSILKAWSDITLPHTSSSSSNSSSETVTLGISPDRDGATLDSEPTTEKSNFKAAKAGDYWRFWLLGVLKEGTYGLSVGEIYGALRDGAGPSYAPELAFKHWKPRNFQGVAGDLTDAELREAFDLPINATALGYYVNDPTALAAEPVAYTAYIKSVKAVAPPSLPIIDWETGASTYNLTDAEQAKWASIMLETSIREGLAGFNWWQYIDWATMPSKPCATLSQCQLLHFGAHYVNGTAKPCWAVLAAAAHGTSKGGL
jgi:hypothetical protein